ncbi:rhamnulokinase [Ruficoccus amylovorans]|uniref:Rhamnulokinase n=1 Tax=Ruficoccus amylovorans TaxID=1804625 RepID=A0A842HL78_9BACT|nr:FGGY-family carbohydrate kinase [Ruficoccus amylovorans]MBC2596444.1 rhamnulokinase [Ruficoccus amylovorans]
MSKIHAAAIDLGATSGRVIVGTWTGEALELTEVHRFPNAFHRLNDNDYWDIGALFSQVRKGLTEAKRLFPDLASCGVDTWGVDHVLLDKDGRLAFPMHAYRDQRTEPLRKRLIDSGDDRKLYDWTGLPPINYNTALQLGETLSAFPALKQMVSRVLLLPDYFNYLLSGKMCNEVSIASTGQLLDINGVAFSGETLNYFGIPAEWFDGPARSGIKLGKVRDIEGLEDVETILVPGHDTSCAFEAIPKSGNDIFISAGTWLLTGGLTAQPAKGEEAYKLGVSNERDGLGGYRPNKILLGLWLLEQLSIKFPDRPTSGAEWDALADKAADLPSPGTLIDCTDESLFNPDDMRAAIDANLRRQGGTPPATLPEYMRLICDSLARSVANTVRQFGQMTGESFDNIAIVGGGSKNQLLCQRIADATGLPVTSYSLEGTSVGNIGYQLLGLGAIENLDIFRAVIARRINKHVYRPAVAGA